MQGVLPDVKPDASVTEVDSVQVVERQLVRAVQLPQKKKEGSPEPTPETSKGTCVDDGIDEEEHLEKMRLVTNFACETIVC